MDKRVPPKDESCGFDSHQPGHQCSMSGCTSTDTQKIDLIEHRECMWLCNECLRTMHEKMNATIGTRLEHRSDKEVHIVPVAHQEEHPASNRKAVGSIPTGDARIKYVNVDWGPNGCVMEAIMENGERMPMVTKEGDNDGKSTLD